MAFNWLQVFRRLYPTGRVWSLPPNSVIERLHNVVADNLQDAYDATVTDVLTGLLPDNDAFTEQDAETWERRLGIGVNPLTLLDQRKAAIIRKLAQPSALGQFHPETIQFELRRAGFTDATVTENTTGFAPPASDTVDHGQPDAIHGIMLHGENEAYEKIVNSIDRDIDRNFSVPNNRQIFFITGGPDLVNDPLQIPISRIIEFRELVCILKPQHLVAYVLAEFIDDLDLWILADGTWDDTGIWLDDAVWID